MTRLLTFALVLLAAVAPAGAQDSALDRGRALLDAGTAAGSLDSLRQSRAVLGVAAAGDGAPAAWARYYQAVADYRIAYALWGSDAPAAVRHAEQGAALVAALADDGRSSDAMKAEAHALHATLLGAQMGLDPTRSASLGPRAQAATAASLRLAPENPRVLLMSAASLLSTPAEWGGDPTLATRQLQAAAGRFAPAADPLAPTWGEGDVHAWLALAHLMANDADAARPHVARAAELQPGSTFVQYKLQPWLAQLDAP